MRVRELVKKYNSFREFEPQDDWLRTLSRKQSRKMFRMMYNLTDKEGKKIWDDAGQVMHGWRIRREWK